MKGFARALWLAAAIAVAALLAPFAASAGEPDASLTVAKHADGPYGTVTTVNIPAGQSKSVYWRVKNQSPGKLTDLLLSDSDTDYPVGWKARWYRGQKEITEGVQGGGHEFTLKKDASARFRLKLKAGDEADQWCVNVTVGKPLLGVLDEATASVNSAVCGL